MRKKRVVAELWLSDHQVDKTVHAVPVTKRGRSGGAKKGKEFGGLNRTRNYFFPPVMKERSFVWKED